jgi:exosortase
VAESVLHFAGYPVARDGVTLRMGPYNLLLADACSGMNSLISLMAVGLLYVYLTARRTIWHTAVLVAAILPVAVSTNIVRVLILMLITYHLGDEAGQGYLHEFAGFVLFLVAVLILGLVDFVLGKAFRFSVKGVSHGQV